ncbi:MAG: hypothetical protein GX606_00100, partial [Elusimicrobia bacterium]|nr:hypothetical protein [Elusimicrobiota bacterium]
MSKTVQQSLLVLGILLLISIGSAVFILVQKQQLAAQNEYLQGQLTDAESRAQMLSKKAGDLESQLSGVRRDLDEKSRENKTLEKKASDADAELRRAKDDMSRLERDKREWDDRLQKMTAERDRLTKELQNRPTQDKIVEKVVEKVVTVPAAGIARSEAGSGTTIVVENKADEEYWAKVLKEKSALEIEIGDAKEKAAEAMLKVEEAKKTASDLEIEVGRLKNEREAILRKIKYGEELADNLSIELARSRNEQRVIKEMADRVSAENQQLRSQVKELTSTKVAL